MCTLTLITPIAAPRAHNAMGPSRYLNPSLRLMMNRDELRTRLRALPPSIHTFGPRSILMPVDPSSNGTCQSACLGTWIGINDRGLFAALLNLTEPDHHSNPAKSPLSRGTIIPALLQHPTLDHALIAAHNILTAHYSPFRLLIGSMHAIHLLHARAHTLEALTLPVLLTSSGLGDHLVHPPRAQLFSQTLARTLSPASQDAFHHHVFPNQHHLSVLMDRAEAHTVSITTLDISAHAATMHYEDVITGQHASSTMQLTPAIESALP
jgi:uncharacterized protein with NRDE domain